MGNSERAFEEFWRECQATERNIAKDRHKLTDAEAKEFDRIGLQIVDLRRKILHRICGD